MIDFDKIVDFVKNVFGSNEFLANSTLLEMGIDPETRRPQSVQRTAEHAEDCAINVGMLGECGCGVED